MKISFAWLKNNSFLEWPKSLTLEKLCEQLPMAGFEIDGVEAVGDDHVLDIAITANRGDCLSLRGIAREIACLNACMFNDILNTSPATTKTDFIKITAPAACSLYAGRLIKNISLQKKLPAEMSDRLTKSGIESINSVVDICNYVMLELGQPLHAFDADKIKNIDVRMARANESIKVLGGQTIALRENTLVIADVNGPQAIAGIIGGFDSAVSDHTKNIFLESAHFIPEAIAGRMRQYGLQTEGAQRFERGVDPALPLITLQYVTDLILQYLGGDAEAIQMTEGHPLQEKRFIHLRPHRIQRILGKPFSGDKIFHILTALGMHIKTHEDQYEIHAPSFRFDVTQEVDLIEELARIEGYQHIPTVPVRVDYVSPNDLHTPHKNFANALIQQGFKEIISYSFISEDLQQLCFPDTKNIRLKNPLSNELAIMRSSLWPSLLQTWQYNMNRQQTRARFFELGTIYENAWNNKLNTTAQHPVLAGLMTGSTLPEQWGEKTRDVDFYDVKAVCENLIGLPVAYQPSTHPMLHSGQSADIFYQGKLLGSCGRLHPRLQQALDLTTPVFLFSLLLDQLPSKNKPLFQTISRFPAVRRDFAFLMPRDQIVGDVLDFVRTQVGALCKEVRLFDVYQGKNMPSDQKSIAFSILLQDNDATLSDEKVQSISEILVETLSNQFGLQLRTA